MNSRTHFLTLLLIAVLSFSAFIVTKSVYLKLSDMDALLARDLSQDYVMARALNDGLNPYQPIAGLLKKYYPTANFCNDLELSPHTPFSILLISRLTFLDIHTFSNLWFFMSILMLATSCLILAGGNIRVFSLTFPALLISYPAIEELIQGQYNSLILFLCTCGFFLFKNGYKFLAGSFIGMCLSLKMACWIVPLYFLLRREWRALSAVVFVNITALIVCIYFFGLNTLSEYFLQTLPKVLDHWVNNGNGKSIYSVPYKFLYPGTYIYLPDQCNLSKISFTYSPYLKPLALMLTFSFAYFVIRKTVKKDFNLSTFGTLLAATSVLNPISWLHYAILAAPKLIEAISMILKNGSKRHYILLFLCIALLYVDYSFLGTHSVPKLGNGEIFILPYSYLLLSLIPTLLIVLIALL